MNLTQLMNVINLSQLENLIQIKPIILVIFSGRNINGLYCILYIVYTYIYIYF